MNNEETMIQQPQNQKAEEVKNTVKTPETEPVKEEKKPINAKKVAAVGAGVIGTASVAAATMLNNGEEEAVVEPTDEASISEEAAESVSQEEATEEVPQNVEEETTSVVNEVQGGDEEVSPVGTDESISGQEPEEPGMGQEVGEPTIVAPMDGGDENIYTSTSGDPVVQPTQTGETDEDAGGDVVILGIEQGESEDGSHYETVYMTNGETVAAVFDGNGDGIADILAVDEDGSQSFEEHELHDISAENIEMANYEQAYLAQQQQIEEQQDGFNYTASNDDDYNNNAEMYEEA